MYQVLLVDDEYYVRKSIQNRVNWARLDCEITAEADNGVRALELIIERKPDIVLVDIMMPEMDGLELIRQAREVSPRTQFAILSGYDDFLYTKEAIRLKVTDYIKKPVDVEELEKAVGEMIHAIEANSQAQQRYTELEDQAKNLGELKIERALNDVCGSAEAAPALQELLDDGLYAWILTYSSPTPGKDQELNILKLELLRFLEDASSGPAHVAANEAFPGEFRALVPAPSVGAVHKTAENLARHLAAQPGAERISLSYSSPAPVSELHDQYDDALRILKSRIIAGHSGLQQPNQLKAPSQNEIDAVFSLLESIKRCLASRQHPKLDNLLNQLFSEKLITSHTVLEDALFSLYSLAREYAVRYNISMPEQASGRMTGTHALLHYNNLGELKEEVRALLRLFFCEGCPIDDEHITTQVKKYIEENYAEKITLKSIAGLFYLNASYLSSLFKQKTGVNLNKYIETVRIERAKNLLTSLDATVIEIASMTGYADPNYFNKTFKKRTGKTPMEYKALHQTE